MPIKIGGTIVTKLQVIKNGVTVPCTIGKVTSGTIFFEQAIPVTYFLMDCQINITLSFPLGRMTTYYIGVLALRSPDAGRLTENITATLVTMPGSFSSYTFPVVKHSLTYAPGATEASQVVWQQCVEGLPNTPKEGVGINYFDITYKGMSTRIQVQRDWRDAPLKPEAKPDVYRRDDIIIPA